MSNSPIRVRIDGYLDGVHGPLTTGANRDYIAQVMGWQDGGEAVDVITNTLALLAEGKAVYLTSHHGYATFSPLANDEDGDMIPASWSRTVYYPDGSIRMSESTVVK